MSCLVSSWESVVLAAQHCPAPALIKHHMLINGRIRCSVPGTSVVPGIKGLAAFRKCCVVHKVDKRTASAHLSAADKQAGVAPG